MAALGISLVACGDGNDGDTELDAATLSDAGTGDAEVDAASVDAASLDDASTVVDAAQEADASVDASATSDASEADAGDTDASEADASEADASEPDAATATTFTRVYEILSANCSPCHTGGASGNLSLANQTTAYQNLVGKAAASGACSSSGLLRVSASKPEESLLVLKLDHSAASAPCGDFMPKGASDFDAQLLAEIEDWIAAGAAND